MIRNKKKRKRNPAYNDPLPPFTPVASQSILSFSLFCIFLNFYFFRILDLRCRELFDIVLFMKHCWNMGEHPAKCLKCGERASWDDKEKAWSMPFDGCEGERRETDRDLPPTPNGCPKYFTASGSGFIVCPVCGLVFTSDVNYGPYVLHPMAQGTKHNTL